MSYDLYFCRREEEPLTFDAVVQWCQQFPQFQKASAAQLWYDNKNTGVYFSIDKEELSTDESQIPKGFHDARLSFNLNFGRPQFFALEAMPFIERLQTAFNLLSVNPQLEDGDGPRTFFSAELIENWSQHNESAIKTLKEMPGAAPLRFIPKIKSNAAWRYNYSRPELEVAAEGALAFVPHLSFFRHIQSSEVGTMFVWTEGIPTLIPDSDWVGIVRRKKKLFGGEIQEIGFVRASTFIPTVSDLLTNFDNKLNVRLLPELNVSDSKKMLQSVEIEASKTDCKLVEVEGLVDVT